MSTLLTKGTSELSFLMSTQDMGGALSGAGSKTPSLWRAPQSARAAAPFPSLGDVLCSGRRSVQHLWASPQGSDRCESRVRLCCSPVSVRPVGL